MANQLEQRPPWLDDEKEIIALLQWFWARILKTPDREKPPLKKLNRDYFKSNETGDQSWYLLQSLSPGLLAIKLNKRRHHFEPDWTGASISLPLEKVEQLGDWLGMQMETELDIWQQEVDKIVNLVRETSSSIVRTINCELLARAPIKFSGKSPDEILTALFKLAGNRDSAMTLRELSARYFWGDSKFLDSRREWLVKVIQDIQLAERRILVNFFLPATFDKVLFIENLDTYHQLIEQQPKLTRDLALVYASGFRLSASRVRDRGGVTLHQSIASSGDSQSFIDWWFNQNSRSLATYFWGDFDFSAMGILKSLNVSFPGIQLWEPGYKVMAGLVDKGLAHPDSHRDKRGQIDPGETGCEFADQVILPGLRLRPLFFDQEGVTFVELENFIVNNEN